MVLKDILAISGEPGLFKFIAQGKNAIIVEHLETGKRSSAFSSAKVSSLEDISVFTESEDLPLSKVFDRIYDTTSGGQTIDPKSNPDELKKYFEGIVPDYSREKVYTSDIKKIFLWYNILQKKNMLVREEPEKADEAASEEKASSDSGTPVPETTEQSEPVEKKPKKDTSRTKK